VHPAFERANLVRRREGSEEDRPLPLKGGNNKYGASGTNKCGHCREKKFKVIQDEIRLTQCVYDLDDMNSTCEKCQLSHLECGAKLSAKEYREQQEHAAAIEAARRAQEQDPSATGLVIRGSPSPRSFRVFNVVRDSTTRALDTQERDPQAIIQRIANDLQTHSERPTRSPQVPMATPQMQMPFFEPMVERFPTAIQPQTYHMPQDQGTFPLAPPVPGYSPFVGTTPLGTAQQFQGQLGTPQMSGTHPTQPMQPQGTWQWWDSSQTSRTV